MTWALEASVKRAEFPPVRGISQRAMRTVLGAMARIAQSDGSFRYGLRGSKIVELSDHSLSVVRRLERWAVEVGILERVEVGGGRKSTRWRIVVDKLMSFLPEETRQKSPPDTPAQPPRHSPGAQTWKSQGIFTPRSPKRSTMTDQPTPSGKRIPCHQHPGYSAGRCPVCVKAAVPPPPSFKNVKAALRRTGRGRYDADERRRREARREAKG